MNYTYGDVRAAYGGEKATQERHDVVVRFFARPLSFPVAWVALRIGLSPNHVTIGSLVLNVGGLVLLTTGSAFWMTAGVVVIMAALVLDCADGNMARVARRFSPMGEWLEGLGSYLLCAGFHLSGAIGAWRALGAGEPVTHWPARVETGGWLITWGGVAAATITVSIMAAAKFSTVFPQVDRGQVVARMGGGWYGALFTVGRNLSFASGLVLPLTLFGIVLRRYDLVLGGFAVLNTGMMLAVLARCTLLARRATLPGAPGR